MPNEVALKIDEVSIYPIAQGKGKERKSTIEFT